MKTQLQALLQQARSWEERIRRTTYSSSVQFTPELSTGEFSITAYWQAANGEKGQYTKKITRELVFGPRERWDMARPVARRMFCSHLRDFMREVLHSRGV